MTIASVRKAIAAVIGVLAQVAAVGALPEEWAPWGAVVIAVATALGVYAVPNDQAYAAKHEAAEVG